MQAFVGTRYRRRVRRAVTAAFALVLASGCHRAVQTGESAYAGREKVDPGTATKDAGQAILWYDARHLTVEGRGWTDTEEFYRRLPARAKEMVPDAVWGLSKHTAGLCVRFLTDADKITARWTVTSPNLAMDHMPATGVSGLDLYVNDHGVWRWTGTGRPRSGPTNEVALAGGIPAGLHEYMLYLPLYNGVRSLEIGVPSAAALYRPGPRPPHRAKPICFYGTSITQGGCASRPGMAHVAILGRMLDRPTINLGFSGAGKMEDAMADLLAELDVAAYVLDCLPNMTAAMVRERVGPFVMTLRKTHPDTPIVLVENIRPQNDAFLPNPRAVRAEKNHALADAYQRLVSKGVGRLTYVRCESLLGDDGEATVDGVHPTDVGFLRFAQALEPTLRKVLAP